MVTATSFVVAGFFGVLALWWWGCTLSASCMYLRTSHMSAGTRMSYRCREKIADGEIPWEKTQRIPDNRALWMKDTACTLCFFACACDKRAVVTATHYIYTCFFCFGHVLLVRSVLQDIPAVEGPQFVGTPDREGQLAEIKHNNDRAAVIATLVRLYLHPHDARTLHLSFDV